MNDVYTCIFLIHQGKVHLQKMDTTGLPMTPAWPCKRDQIHRLRFIEILAYWEGRITTRHLCESFDIKRQQASRDINLYLEQVPDNLVYDRHLKGYCPAATFQPVITQGQVGEYLHIIDRHHDFTASFLDVHMGLAGVERVQATPRNVRPDVLRPLIRGIRESKNLYVNYSSLAQPSGVDRVLAPHHLVCTPLRWHVRAWDYKNERFGDFVLSRFGQNIEVGDKSGIDPQQDRNWQECIDIVIQPDSRLSPEQRKMIARDYGMTRQQFRINTRKALVEYQIRALGIHSQDKLPNPMDQQIEIANMAAIEGCFFG
jgi:predicted DNA-binding transcriptional regulator YafY